MKMNIKKILSAVLCVAMVFGSMLVLASCDGSNDTPQEGEIAVVRVAQSVEKNQKITEEMVKIDYVLEENVPFNAIKEIEKVVGMYATQKLYVGEYVFADKLSDVDINSITELSREDYIYVSDYIRGGDATATIQKLVDDNPGKTIYFPDGEYLVSKSITTPADPKKAVSFRFANFAILRASSEWSGGSKAMIRIGAGAASKDSDEDPTASISIYGGIFDGNGKASAISIEGGRDMHINDVSIKNAVIGINIVNTNDDMYQTTSVRVDNVDITGTGSNGSKGIVIGTSGNSLNAVHISNVHVGVELTGANNNIKSVIASYNGKSKDSSGFYDKSQGNVYDMCFSEQFAIGFRMKTESVSAYNACYAYWKNGNTGRSYGFMSDGKFNSVIRACKVDLTEDNDNEFLYVTSMGGKGIIENPIILYADTMTDEYYLDYLVTGKVEG